MTPEAVAHESYGLLVGLLTFLAIVVVTAVAVAMHHRQNDLERRVTQLERRELGR